MTLTYRRHYIDMLFQRYQEGAITLVDLIRRLSDIEREMRCEDQASEIVEKLFPLPLSSMRVAAINEKIKSILLKEK